LQDFEGDIDLVFFSKTYAECRNCLKLDEILALRGSIDPANERNPEKISLKVSGIADIAQLCRSAARKAASGEKPPEPVIEKPYVKQPEEIHIRLNEGAADSEENLYPLRDYLAENSGPCSMFIHVPVQSGEKTIRAVTGIAFSAGSDVINEIKKCKCVAEVWRK
jgi:DNA polymerase-3 subunit alpha